MEGKNGPVSDCFLANDKFFCLKQKKSGVNHCVHGFVCSEQTANSEWPVMSTGQITDNPYQRVRIRALMVLLLLVVLALFYYYCLSHYH